MWSQQPQTQDKVLARRRRTPQRTEVAARAAPWRECLVGRGQNRERCAALHELLRASTAHPARSYPKEAPPPHGSGLAGRGKRTEQAWGASWWRSVRHAGLEGSGRHRPSLSSPGRPGGLSKTGSPSRTGDSNPGDSEGDFSTVEGRYWVTVAPPRDSPSPRRWTVGVRFRSTVPMATPPVPSRPASALCSALCSVLCSSGVLGVGVLGVSLLSFLPLP